MRVDRFDRLNLLYGAAGLEKLRNKSVAVFGLGGVGSYAAEGLVRGGLGRLTLIDFDQVDITNLNRQVHAVAATVGQAKARAMAERCRAINPDAQIEPIEILFSAENSSELLAPGYDYVLDCIDQVTAKLHLIESCHNSDLKLISSMGAANKIDPTRIRVDDLEKTRKCRLARIIRKELRKRGIEHGIKVVYSLEGFRPLAEGRRDAEEDASYQDRRAPLGSSSVIPPMFGLTMAGEVIRDLLGAD
ncbi:MAG: tRNA cyclic N6-threonylcarbamoyladenosine(37) synthase TcdA [Desulfuromonas sp.]|nr:MAG: tRNA cyclic N6-threonylcarbamoyladenosine(37) synthase TcdA [Desulfuromonas sp.]